MTSVWVKGSETDVDAADQLLADVRRLIGAEHSIVAPTGGAVVTDPESISVVESRWGLVVGDTASIRWRVEGDRALISVVSETNLSDIGAQEVECEDISRSSDQILMWQQWVRGSAFEGGVSLVNYRTDMGSFVRVSLEGGP